jgi:hypothetical protein
MADIVHRVGISATLERVHEAVGTTDGLAGFWTSTLDGDPSAGGEMRFYFGQPEPSALMQVEENSPGRVRWHCAAGPDEWVGTELVFALESTGDEPVVLFTHGGWREVVPFMAHCSTKRAVFLLGMKDWLEGGPSSAFPNDRPISSWG